MTSSDLLDELAGIADDAGLPALALEARDLSARLAEGRFYVACVGQFKRGKSTLLNALVGVDVLPTGILPVTAVPIVLRYGEPAARVRGPDGWQMVSPSTLATYVAEFRNPGNGLGIRGVEVFLPSPLLAGGLCLVDTPGLGSPIEANSSTTREFLPQIDAAVAVLGTDPPISHDEVELIAETARQVDTIILVLNKSDQVAAAARTEVAAFTARTLESRIGRQVGSFSR